MLEDIPFLLSVVMYLALPCTTTLLLSMALHPLPTTMVLCTFTWYPPQLLNHNPTQLRWDSHFLKSSNFRPPPPLPIFLTPCPLSPPLPTLQIPLPAPPLTTPPVTPQNAVLAPSLQSWHTLYIPPSLYNNNPWSPARLPPKDVFQMEPSFHQTPPPAT